MTNVTKSQPQEPRRRRRVGGFIALIVAISVAVWFQRDRSPTGRDVPIPAISSDLRPELVELIEQHVATVRAAPEDPIALATLGLVYEANTLWGEARDCYARAAAIAPDEPMWIHHQAVATKLWGDPTNSLTLLRDGVARFPKFAPLQWSLGDALAEAGSLDEAATAFERAIELAPDKCEGYVGLADIKIRQGDNEEALRLLEHAVQIDPYYKSARYSLGLALRGLGRTDEAKQQLRMGTAAKKRGLEDAWGEQRAEYNLTVSSMMGRSDQLMNAGQIPEAIKLLKTALTLSPGDVQVFNQLAAAYLMGGQFPLAEEALLRAKQVDENSLGIYINLAACYLGMQRPADALAAADRAVELDPGVWEGPFNRGLALTKLKQYESAYQALVATVRLDPPGAGAHIALGDVCLLLDHYAESKENYLKAVEREPRTPLAQYGLCRACIKLQHWEDAQTALDALRALVPTDPVLPVLQEQIPDLSGDGG